MTFNLYFYNNLRRHKIFFKYSIDLVVHLQGWNLKLLDSWNAENWKNSDVKVRVPRKKGQSIYPNFVRANFGLVVSTS